MTIELIDLHSIIEKNNSTLENKFIIIKTGWGKFWGTKGYHDEPHPHITEEVAKFLLEKKISGIGIDTLSPDKPSTEGYYAAHEVFLRNNIFIIENIANLNKINKYEFTCIIAPLNIVSTESPIRLIAVI